MAYSVWGSFGTNIPTRDVFATETFATLRVLTPPPATLNASIEVDGGLAKGDSLGGIFYYDQTSVLADDAISVIAPIPLPAAGRWIRIDKASFMSLQGIGVIDTIALLKALPLPNTSSTYIVRGFAAINDGGGGFYYWNSVDNRADDGGTIIQLNLGGVGRFNKLF